MAYSAPKWTQMTAPSGATAVNALTTAGDLFNKAMDSANTGLKKFDTGVETRLQDDSDVNTAALRRQLEGAGSLEALNAMQGQISAEGLQGYGKRIDADALSQSFNKERDVMRGEFQNQFNERMSTGYAGAVTADEVRGVDAQVAAANEENSWLDVSSQIDQGSAGLKTALAKEAQTASNAQLQAQTHMNVTDLEVARKALVPGSLNYEADYETATRQISAKHVENQNNYERDLSQAVQIAKGQGRDALNKVEAEFSSPEFIAKYGSKIDIGGLNRAVETAKSDANRVTVNAGVSGSLANLQEQYTRNDVATQQAIDGIPGAENFAAIGNNGRLKFAPGTPASMRKQIQEGAKANGFEPISADVGNRADRVSAYLDMGFTKDNAESAVDSIAKTLRDTTQLSITDKSTLTAYTDNSLRIRDDAIELANKRHLANSKQFDLNENYLDRAIDGDVPLDKWVRDPKNFDQGGILPTWGESLDEILPEINDIRANGLGVKGDKDFIPGNKISEEAIKYAILRTQDVDMQVESAAAFIDELKSVLRSGAGDGQVDRIISEYSNFKAAKNEAELEHTLKVSSKAADLREAGKVRDPSARTSQSTFNYDNTIKKETKAAAAKAAQVEKDLAARAAKKLAEAGGTNTNTNTTSNTTEVDLAEVARIKALLAKEGNPRIQQLLERQLERENNPTAPEVEKSDIRQLTAYQNTMIKEQRGTIGAAKAYDQAVDLAIEAGDMEGIREVLATIDSLTSSKIGLGVSPMLDELRLKIQSALEK
jgi:hypothetical protein